MNPAIMILGNFSEECKIISELFVDYTEYIDFETDINEFKYINFNFYDIVIFTNDNFIKQCFFENINCIKILLTNSLDKEFISLQMKYGIDIIIPYDTNNIKVNHLMLIYNVINSSNKNQLKS